MWILEQAGCAGCGRRLEAELDRHQPAGDVLAQVGQQLLEQREGLGLVLVQRIALAIAAQADDVAAGGRGASGARATACRSSAAGSSSRRCAHLLGAEQLPRARRRGRRRPWRRRSRISSGAMPSSAAQSAIGSSRPRSVLAPARPGPRRPTARRRPWAAGGASTRSSMVSWRISVDDLGQVVGLHELLALLEHRLALVVDDVVVLQEVLADLVVALLDLASGRWRWRCSATCG